MDKEVIRLSIKTVFIYLVAFAKGLWFAAYDTISLIVYSFLLHALMFYYNSVTFAKVEIGVFSNLIELLVTNWFVFFFIFMIYRVAKSLQEDLNG